MSNQRQGKVVGIGGIFFKSSDPTGCKKWYGQHMGMITDQWGASFEFRLADKPEVKGFLQWSPFDEKSDHFDTSKQEFMINYRVVHLEALLDQLSQQGVEICGPLQEYEYGKFAHIIDNEGRKVELWEPPDNAFDEIYQGETNK